MSVNPYQSPQPDKDSVSISLLAFVLMMAILAFWPHFMVLKMVKLMGFESDPEKMSDRLKAPFIFFFMFVAIMGDAGVVHLVYTLLDEIYQFASVTMV